MGLLQPERAGRAVARPAPEKANRFQVLGNEQGLVSADGRGLEKLSCERVSFLILNEELFVHNSSELLFGLEPVATAGTRVAAGNGTHTLLRPRSFFENALLSRPDRIAVRKRR